MKTFQKINSKTFLLSKQVTIITFFFESAFLYEDNVFFAFFISHHKVIEVIFFINKKSCITL